MTEKWKPVVGFEAFYQISSEGRAERTSAAQNTYVGRPLKAHNSRGYKFFAFAVDNSVKCVTTHKAVWEAFVGPIPPGYQINHKNGFKDDNRLCNLELVTPSENARHAWRELGRVANINPSPGSKNGRAKLTEADIPEIISLRQGGWTQQRIADKFGVDQTSISRVLLGKGWATVPDRVTLRDRFFRGGTVVTKA